MRHAPSWKPIKGVTHSTDLGCGVLRVYAYRGQCACGWVSPRAYATVDEARRVATEHRLEELGLD